MTSISAALFHSSLRIALSPALPHPSHNHLTPPLGFSTETHFSPPSGTVTTGTLMAAPQKATNQHLLSHGQIELTVTGIKSICQERLALSFQRFYLASGCSQLCFSTHAFFLTMKALRNGSLVAKVILQGFLLAEHFRVNVYGWVYFWKWFVSTNSVISMPWGQHFLRYSSPSWRISIEYIGFWRYEYSPTHFLKAIFNVRASI